ncbi:MAG: hypothetical protein ACI9KE_004709 [Polyangiales bacterium]|jgi:hypothetical protein
MHRPLLSAACLFALAFASSCGGFPERVTVEVEAPLDLLSVVPPNPSLLVHIRPDELMASPVLGPIVREFIGAEDLERIELRFGLRPREVAELVFAEYEDEFVVIARATRAVRPIAEAITSRMNTIQLESDEPVFRRGGFVGTQRRELAVIRENVIAYGTMAPPMAGLVARVRRDLPSVRSSETEWLDSSAPLSFYRMEPLDFPIDSPVGMVFAQQRRARVTFVESNDSVGLQVAFDGEFPPHADSNLRALVAAVAQSDLGRLIGLDQAFPTLVVSQTQGRLTLEADWPAEPLRTGLRRALAPNMEVLLGETP